jgi:hypothetical protein
VRGLGSELTIPEQFYRKHPAYISGETPNLELWNGLAQRAMAGSISGAEMAERFQNDILPFWRAQKELLKQEGKSLKGPEQAYELLVADFAESRYQWASALIEVARDPDATHIAESVRLMQQTNAINAKLDLIGIHARMDHRPRALAATSPVTQARQFLTGHYWTCVSAPSAYSSTVASFDDKSDGPAMRHSIGCRAQRLFMSGDYERLDAAMRKSMSSLEDLPDGSSSYEGMVGGLLELFRSGTLAIDSGFERAADWRRAVHGSPMADLAEALLISEWAWIARGNGFADSISNQNLALYTYRTQMASAALDDLKAGAADNPLWYTLSLDVGLDLSKDKEALRALFDAGETKAPGYRPLYRSMLRALMPRWGGSYEEVDKFINQIYARTAPARGFERYAELYSMYDRLEGDDLDLFADTPAFWSGMRSGYTALLKRYPRSDAVLNRFAYFACRAGDGDNYKRLRGEMGKRLSSSSWTSKYTVEFCDKTLAVAGALPAT